MSKLGLTIESNVNGKKVLHNGMLGRYITGESMDEVTLKRLYQKASKLGSFLSDNTDYHVEVQTYGVRVNSSFKSVEGGEAFVGYDESVDFNVRLCYATDTFLAMDLQNMLEKVFGKEGTAVESVEKGYESTSKKVLGDENGLTLKGNIDSVKTDASTKKDVNGVEDFGWGAQGESFIMGMLDKKVEKVFNHYLELNIVRPDKVLSIKENLLNILHTNKDTLTLSAVFSKGSPAYGLMSDVLNEVKTIIPKTYICEDSRELVWKMTDGTEVMSLFSKVSGERQGSGRVSVSEESPVYVTVRKFLDLISSNIGYKKLVDKSANMPALKGSQVVKKVKSTEVLADAKVKEDTGTKESKTVDAPQINVLSKYHYYDMYLDKTGRWSNASKKYELLKGMIGELVEEYDVSAVSIQGIDETEIVLDWVIGKKTYTMALTKSATKVGELETEYDVAVAYDNDVPEMLKVLMKDKLDTLIK